MSEVMEMFISATKSISIMELRDIECTLWFQLLIAYSNEAKLNKSISRYCDRDEINILNIIRDYRNDLSHRYDKSVGNNSLQAVIRELMNSTVSIYNEFDYLMLMNAYGGKRL